MDLSSTFLMSDKGLELLSKLFHSSGEGLMVFDSKGKIQAMNPRAEEMFEYNEKELIGQTMEILVPESLRAKHVEYRKSFVEKPSVRSMGLGLDLKAVRKSGDTFPVEISLSYLNYEDETLIVAFITDITLRKEQEKQLEEQKSKLEEYTSQLEEKVRYRTQELEHMNMGLQSQVQERKIAEAALKRSLEDVKRAEKEILKSLEKEKELNELKSRFVSMASHEFRTPLTTIASSANLIKKYTENEQQSQREKHADRIVNGVKNLTGILNDFLSLEKLESGHVSLKTESFNLADLVGDIIEEMSLVLKKDQTIRLENKENITMTSDPHLLKNLIFNLLSNASKYSSEGDEINLRYTVENSLVHIEVEDKGIGIPAKEQKNLFSRFFRAGNVTNIQGTGLGLHIVKKYIDLLKGNISFKSEEGKGSTFKIIIPLQTHGKEDDSGH